jgi:UDP-N-acetylglucosamine 2-epimerase
MYEALMFARERAEKVSNVLRRLGLTEKRYLLATVHRAENTDDPVRLRAILEAFARLEEPVIFPVHPRTRKAVEGSGFRVQRSSLRFIDPLGYLDMVQLMSAARLMLTDSGGIQKESYWLGVPCITLRDETEWVETVTAGWNVLVGADTERIVAAVHRFTLPVDRPALYGGGRAVAMVIGALGG